MRTYSTNSGITESFQTRSTKLLILVAFILYAHLADSFARSGPAASANVICAPRRLVCPLRPLRPPLVLYAHVADSFARSGPAASANVICAPRRLVSLRLRSGLWLTMASTAELRLTRVSADGFSRSEPAPGV